MAQLPSAFDSSQHEDMRDGFDPIPKDTYISIINQRTTNDFNKRD